MTAEQYDILMFVVATLSMLITATIAIWQMQRTAQQAFKHNQMTLFAEYTRRYQDIMLSMPEDVFLGTAKLDETTKKHLRLYFDLCSEEYYLHRREHIIDEQVWQMWQEGIKEVMKSELYQECWHELQHEYNNEFQKFIERIIK